MNGFEPVDSDIELLRAAPTDPDAFGDFYRRHAVAVERWIRAQTPDMATGPISPPRRSRRRWLVSTGSVARPTSQRAAGCTGSPATWSVDITAAGGWSSR
ncbi:MAG TPA: hypothetical protein VIH85_27335, partial [Solirubrobacteraceae bacterium]